MLAGGVLSLISVSCATAGSGEARDSDGLTALHRAAGRGDLAAVKAGVERDEDVLAVDSKMGVSVLHKAVYSGNSEVVAYLLDHGALIDLQSPSNGNTPLHDAIYFKGGNGLKVINVLLHHDPNLAIRNRAGLTPVESARLLKDSEVVSALEGYHRSRHTEAGARLMTAVRTNKSAQVKKLLSDPKINVEEADDQGFPPLIWAAREGYADLVRLLLAKGANPNEQDQWMRANAAHKAAFWGRPEVMKVLVTSGIDLNARGGYNGYTPLHDAVAQNHVEVVSILLAAKVRTDIQGHDGKTSWDLAKSGGSQAIIKLFDDAKKDGAR